MTILLLHGWTSAPGGVKPAYLAAHGQTVLNPKLPDEDFPAGINGVSSFRGEAPCPTFDRNVKLN